MSTSLTLNSVQVAALAGVKSPRVMRAIAKGELPGSHTPLGPGGVRRRAIIPYEVGVAWAQQEAIAQADRAEVLRRRQEHKEAKQQPLRLQVTTLARTVAALQDELRALRTDLTPTSYSAAPAVSHAGVGVQ